MALADSEKLRFVDRIRAVTFREARDAGAEFITRYWVAARIKRSENFVRMNWNSNPYECEMSTAPIGIGGKCLSDASKQIIAGEVGKQKKSIRNLQALLEQERGKKRSHMSIQRELHRMGLKPFHVIRKPLLTDTSRENRLWFARFLSNWTEDDALHLAPSDEFYIYSVRRPNHQNDRVWATSPKDIDDDEHFRGVPQYPSCVGIFVLFTARSLMWIVKDKGTTWTGEYFRTQLQERILPFLKDEQNVISVPHVTLLHDKAPMFKSLATQQLLRDSGVDFFSNNEWPGSSPDLNPAEHIGAIIKEEVEKKLLISKDGSQEALMTAIQDVLHDIQDNVDLFQSLLRSYPKRIQAVLQNGGGPTGY